jgi:hypothetical protein
VAQGARVVVPLLKEAFRLEGMRLREVCFVEVD